MILLRLLICIAVFSCLLYAYIDRNNQLTELRYDLPTVADEILVLEEKCAALRYKIDQSESPLRLMELARTPEFSHLHQPRSNEIVVVPSRRKP